MATSTLLTLIDDIASLLDDVALLTKAATKKTAGVLGDDLAVNAEQVTGVRVDRELPVVWAVAKGSAVNKSILVPAALLISAIVPWLVTPLLMLGGAYLCFEGFEKVAHRFLHGKEEHAVAHAERVKAIQDETVDLVAFERNKIRGAIRTDFILSAEIIAITLGVVADAAFATRLTVLVLVAVLITVGVYGLVAAIVKLDDLGRMLVGTEGAATSPTMRQRAGLAILASAPVMMRTLSVAGTVAMFLVGGGILVHGFPALAHFAHELEHAHGVVAVLGPILFNGLVGLMVGALLVMVVSKLNTRGDSVSQ